MSSVVDAMRGATPILFWLAAVLGPAAGCEWVAGTASRDVAQCSEDELVDPTPGDCRKLECVEGAVVSRADDTDLPLEDPTPGDCRTLACENGETRTVVNDEDVLDPRGDCKLTVCLDGELLTVA